MKLSRALNATADFCWEPKTALQRAIGEVFSAQHIPDLAGIDRQNPRGDEPSRTNWKQLVLDDEGRHRLR